VAAELGDALTRQEIPLLWPLGTRFELALVSRTGNRVETSWCP
jgi:hypothetical protein